MKIREALFTTIARGRKAKGMESASGEGSSLAYTNALRETLPWFLKHLGIKSMLDIPCGDYNWMSHVYLEDIEYTGADIVRELVEQNRKKYPAVHFEHLDLLTDSLPQVDLIFCRDCLMHMSYGDIRQALDNIKASRSKWLLTTTHPGCENRDIDTGRWFPINLLAAPFSFPAPAHKLIDGGRVLALWRIAELWDA